MLSKNDRRIAVQFKQKLQKITPLDSIVVYGSRARGDSAPESDLDVYIEVPGITAELRRRISEVAWEVGFSNDIIISTFVVTPYDISEGLIGANPLVKAVEKEGNPGLSEEQIRKLAQYRIRQAQESLKEAEILARERSWRGAINRAYYAMFYAVLALTVVKGYSTSKHAGVLAFFDREYVKPGIFPKELSKNLHLAFERRQIQDYGEFIIIDEVTSNETIEDAVEFVDVIATDLIASIYPRLR